MMKEKIHALVENALKKEKIREKIEIEEPKDKAHGDFACNIALKLTKKFGIPPRELAEKIVKNIEKPDFIDEITIEGPGFINFKLSGQYLLGNLDDIVKHKDTYGSSEEGREKTIVVDLSSTNIAKPLGVHHLLSTIIGQSVSNIYKFLGYETVNINHIGDWGTQFGKLIYAFRKWGNKEQIEKNPIKELLNLYIKFHEEAEKDTSIEDHGREEFLRLEEGDKENHKIWEWICDMSMRDIQKTLNVLGGIHFDHIQGESFYNDKMDPILKDGKEREIFVKGKEGAWVVKFPEEKYPDYLVQKSDGATLYSTRDLAAIKYRIDTWHPEKILYAVDVAQSLHFQQLFETARMFGWEGTELQHVVFGRMQFPEGKMSTREGKIIFLEEVLQKAEEKARAIVEEKNPELPSLEKDKVAHSVGIGAVKYSILSQNRTTNVVFTWEKMLSLEGNSAPYLQYSYARACSILRKAGSENPEFKDNNYKLNEYEEKILRHLTGFNGAIKSAAEEYKPNLLANYLYELTQEFNNFYNQVPVLQAEKEEEKKLRLKLVKAVTIVLKTGLNLLGLEAPERM